MNSPCLDRTQWHWRCAVVCGNRKRAGPLLNGTTLGSDRSGSFSFLAEETPRDVTRCVWWKSPTASVADTHQRPFMGDVLIRLPFATGPAHDVTLPRTLIAAGIACADLCIHNHVVHGG